MILAEIHQSDIVLFSVIILLVFFLIFLSFVFGYWVRRHYCCPSPYTGSPMRRASELPFQGAKKVLQYLFDMHEYDNRIFELKRSAVCRETGRIFPNCITWFNTMQVDWSFLHKRYPGNYVSWGSLSDIQKANIRDDHESLENFQTKKSCPLPAPSDIETQYVFTKPGPLYVDINSRVLIGWQCVPGTELEVLIVQKPKPPFGR